MRENDKVIEMIYNFIKANPSILETDNPVSELSNFFDKIGFSYVRRELTTMCYYLTDLADYKEIEIEEIRNLCNKLSYDMCGYGFNFASEDFTHMVFYLYYNKKTNMLFIYPMSRYYVTHFKVLYECNCKDLTLNKSTITEDMGVLEWLRRVDAAAKI